MKKKLLIIIPATILAVALICGGVVFAATYGAPSSDAVPEETETDIPADLSLVASDTLPTGQLAEYYIDDNGNSYMYVDGKLRSRSGASLNDRKTLPYANGKLTRDQALSNAMLFLADKEDFNEFSLCFEREDNGKYTFDFHRAVKGFATPGSYSVTIGRDGQVSKWSDYGIENSSIYDTIDESLLEGVTKEVLLDYCQERCHNTILEMDFIMIHSDNNGGYSIECGYITDHPYSSRDVAYYPLG